MTIQEQVEKEGLGTPKRIIGDYLLERMKNDPDMEKKYDEAKRTLDGCYSFITAVAKRKAVDSCYCMTDEEAFDLAVHYALDGAGNDLEEPANTNDSEEKPVEPIIKPAPQPQPKPKKVKTAKVEKKDFGEQLTLF